MSSDCLMQDRWVNAGTGARLPHKDRLNLSMRKGVQPRDYRSPCIVVAHFLYVSTYLTGGSVDGSGLFKHVGWPKPPLLIPVPPEGFGVMSNTILSGRFESPDTPPTWPSPSSDTKLRTRHATMWSVQAVATYAEATNSLTVLIKPEPTAEDVNTADALTDHWVFARPKIGTTQHQFLEAAIGDAGIDRIAVLQAIKTASRLHG